MRKLLTSVAGVLALLAAMLVVTADGAAAAPRTGKPALSATPYLGWNTYYGLGGDFNEKSVKEIADSLVTRGLSRAGYDIVWLDGGWQSSPPRTTKGDLAVDPARFPSGMKGLTAYLHSKGLRAGIYTDAGPYLPASCGLGSHGYYQRDADQFAAWGFDAVKVDFLCGIAADLDPKTVYTEFAKALRNNKSHRPMIFNLCNPVTSPDWGEHPEEQQSTYSWSYAPKIAQSWRTYTDAGFQRSIKFPDVLRNYDANARHPEAAGPGHWNDPDYLGPELGMTTTEFRTQMTLWSVAAAPLIIASDVRTLKQDSIDILTDPDVLAINQDKAGVQARRVGPAGSAETWVKPLADGSKAVALLNRGDTARVVSTTARAAGLYGGRFALLDAWTNRRTETGGTIRATVPAHGTALFRVAPARGGAGEPAVTLAPPRVNGSDGRSTVVAPGDTLRVEVEAVNDGLRAVDRVSASLTAPAGWVVTRNGSGDSKLPAGTSRKLAFTVRVPTGAAVGAVTVKATLTYRTQDRRRTLNSDAALQVAPAPPTAPTVLSHHPWFTASSGWLTPAVDTSVGGTPLSMVGTGYATGFGVASPSTIGQYLGGRCTRLTGRAGLDDTVRNVGPEGATARFTLVGDGRQLFRTDVLTRDDVANFDVDLTGVRVLYLEVDDGGDGGYNDRADWTGLNVTCHA